MSLRKRIWETLLPDFSVSPEKWANLAIFLYIGRNCMDLEYLLDLGEDTGMASAVSVIASQFKTLHLGLASLGFRCGTTLIILGFATLTVSKELALLC
jgi:hypothetical protein